ncbi:GntR family transcriptional regulator [Chelativorans salis]|uniref:GntR family transcriptional regulator n=1 Tax=Chelativorans salis TaxID=2978478 RepID=A0ABT2LQ70_9HYPH|nr:GntR family transcriptional regulator [Chelativorans sp. EGI FJ00035]MCT7376695.1 GntR family transcriptional regulator [Chelativorans sp. EGI FJ00035]
MERAIKIVNSVKTVDNLKKERSFIGMEISNDTQAMVSARRERSLTTIVRDRLEQMILKGELGAGMRLNEQALSKVLGVSRGPIREAARLLERDGLVASVANQGAFVRQLSIEEALELYDLRAVIAGHACAQLAERASAAAKREMRERVEEMDRCIATEEEARYFELNLAFHDRIAELSGGKRTLALYTSLGKEVRLLRRRVLRGTESMRFSNEEHKQIVGAIEAGDAPAARQAAEQHHINGKRRWLDTL